MFRVPSSSSRRLRWRDGGGTGSCPLAMNDDGDRSGERDDGDDRSVEKKPPNARAGSSHFRKFVFTI